jgi:large subunit ribosomal protein L21
MTYAVVKTGGKQYRVEQGQSLVVDRLPVDDGARVDLEPLLYVDGSTVLDGGDVSKVKVEARVLAHQRGPKLRIVKFKPKRGYKRRTGHRQELTRLEVTAIKVAARASRSKATSAGADAPKAADANAPKRATGDAPKAARGDAPKPAARRARKPAASKSSKPDEEANGGS